MSLMKSIILIVVVSLSGCAQHHNSMDISGASGCEQLQQNNVDIVFYNNTEAWKLTWGEKSLTPVTVPNDYFGLTLERRKKRRLVYKTKASKINKIPMMGGFQGYWIDGPVHIGSDGALGVSTLYKGYKYESNQVGLAVLDLPNNNMLTIFSTLNRVKDVIIDKNLVVAIEAAPVAKEKNNAMDYIAKSMGHGIPYHDVYVNVYDFQGKNICSVKVASELAYANGFVAWGN